MLRLLAAYFATAFPFVLMDAGWLSYMGPRLYKPVLGAIMTNSVDIPAAVAFYVIYIGGVVYFAVLPAVKSGGVVRAVINGALLALVAYGTYDLTNQATLKVWSMQITAYDLCWGMLASAAAAAVGTLAARAVRR